MGQEWEVVSISESEVSKDKVEVCVKCEGVGGVGWEPPKAVIPFHMLLTIQCFYGWLSRQVRQVMSNR